MKITKRESFVIMAIAGLVVIVGGVYAQSQIFYPSKLGTPQMPSPSVPGISAQQQAQLQAQMNTQFDQSATTTPFVQAQAQAKLSTQADVQAPTQSQVAPTAATFGALTHTYTDKTTGLTIGYPDGMEVVNGGDVSISDTQGRGSVFSLKVCSPVSPCGMNHASTAIHTLTDVLAPQSITTDEGVEHINYSSPSSVTTANGITLTKHDVWTIFTDAAGKDVTMRQCGAAKCFVFTEYVAYKSPTNYVKLQVMSNQDTALMQRILNSIKY